MILSSGQIEQLLHGNKEWQAWEQPLKDILAKYQINTPQRIAMFVAQCGHESLNFTVLEEGQDVTHRCITAIVSVSLMWSMLIVWVMAIHLAETDGCTEGAASFSLLEHPTIAPLQTQ